MDSQYQTFTYEFIDRGLVARYTGDEVPPGMWLNLNNCEARQENAISSRHGLNILTANAEAGNLPLADLNIHTISRLSVKLNNSVFRYAGAGQNIYRSANLGNAPFAAQLLTVGVSTASRTGNVVTITTIAPHGLVTGQAVLLKNMADPTMNGTQVDVQVVNATQFIFTQFGGNVNFIVPAGTAALATSGNRMSVVVYRPDLTSYPYAFFADGATLLKDNGTLSRFQSWGITVPPLATPTIQTANPFLDIIDLFDEGSVSSFTLTNISGGTVLFRAAFAIGAANNTSGGAGNILPGLQTVIPTFSGSATRLTNVATFTSLLPHGLQSGLKVNVIGFVGGDVAFNDQSVTITVTGTTTFTYPNTGPDGPSGGAGQWSAMPQIQVGQILDVDVNANNEAVYVAAVDDVSFVATFAKHHIGTAVNAHSAIFSGTISAGTTGSIAKSQSFNLNVLTGTTIAPDDDDIISFWVQTDDPFNLNELKIFFDVSDGSFSRDYYWKSVSPVTYQPAVAGTRTAGDVMTARIFDRASARADARRLGVQVNDLVPTDLDDLHRVRPRELNPGASAWSLIQIKRSEFVTVGRADTLGFNWANVGAWKIQAQAAPNTNLLLKLDDILFLGGNGLDSYGASPYDYRVTYYNANTGLESNPSQPMVTSLAVRRQPIQVTWVASLDPQVTHARVYRRGGTLNDFWRRIADVPIGTNTYKDVNADVDIASADLLQLDNDAPVTTALVVPVMAVAATVAPTNGPFTGMFLPQFYNFTIADTSKVFYPSQLVTIGAGATEEVVYVKQGGLGAFTAWTQYQHAAGEQIVANSRPNTPMNLCGSAFDRLFLAGDPNNPHILYFSKKFRPESFSPAGSVEVGKPDDPIMALVPFKGALYVLTSKTIWTVYDGGNDVMLVVSTPVKHGLQAQFGWCIGTGMIWYISYDGVYVFNGGQETLVSEITEWIWTGKNLGPVPAIDPSQLSQTIMSFGLYNEIFICYVDQTGTKRRLIWEDSTNKKRFRNDDIPCSAMFFEEDSGTFLVSKGDGNIYFDRTALDYDLTGYGGPLLIKQPIQTPINITLQSMYDNQKSLKNTKVYNEFTIDIDTGGDNLDVTLMFDNGKSSLDLGTVNTNGRQQVNFNLNAGKGVEARNVSLVVNGTTTHAVTMWAAFIRGVVNAELRKSYDSYFTKYGTDEYKFGKQCYFEYVAPDPGGIVMQGFLEGSTNPDPALTFTMPQSTVRAARRFRVGPNPPKGKIWRWIATSASDFQLYDESYFEFKVVGGPKGYQKQQFNAG